MGKKRLDIFSNEKVMVVLTTSPAGLGHVRVTEAIRGGISDQKRMEIVGLEDPSIQFLHRVASRNRPLRGLMEFIQNDPFVEKYFTKYYRGHLKKKTDEVYDRLSTLIKRRRPKPEVFLVIATHHSLAHQVAAVKNRLSREFGMCVVLAVVVTDDSPQKIWGVVGADYLFVPSKSTKESLVSYMKSFSDDLPEVIVSPYPVSGEFCKDVSEEIYQDRLKQVNPKTKFEMKIMLPISGAAVQLSYFQDMIAALARSDHARITVVSRESSYTKEFLKWCQDQAQVKVVADVIDRDVVESYESEYAREVFAVEVTKPSEQTFKVLNTPKQRGGVVMLFSDPVGRQEDDNLAFLQRHELIPSESDSQILDDLLLGEKAKIDAEFLKRASGWRGLLLPKNGSEAGEAIIKFRESGILKAMMEFSGFIDHPELSGKGVDRFWRKLAVRIEKKCG